MGAGKTIIILGAMIMLAGVLVALGDKLPLRLFHLPGDIVIRGKNTVIYLPLMTCFLLSALLTVVFSFFGRK